MSADGREMAKKKWPGGKRLVFVLSLAFSLMFLAFSLVSAVTFSRVSLAQQQIDLVGPERIAELQPNGTLWIGFRVRVANPTDFTVRISSISWYSQVDNGSGDPRVIPLASNFTSGNLGLTVPSNGGGNLSFGWYITGETLAKLKGYVNFSNSHGHDYTLETIPYEHSFEFIGTLDDFKHEYLRENYLNGLVTIELVYTYSAEEA